jgi:hypothetical protein
MIKINPAITNIVERMLELYRNQLIDKNINASNTLSNTATTIVEVDGTSLMVSFNLEDYWKYVEYGRRPGKRPPIDAIEQWIKVKPIIPDPINGRVPTTKQLAFLISRKIGMEGTKAQRPLEKAVYSDSMELLINQLKNEIVGQLNEQISNEISKIYR